MELPRSRPGHLGMAGVLVIVVAACSAGGGASPSGSPTGQHPASATTSPTSSPTADVAKLFVGKMKAMSSSTMVLTGDLTVGGIAVAADGRYDSNGANSYSTTTMAFGATKQTTESTTWSGKTYERKSGGAWYEQPPKPNDAGVGKVMTSVSAATDVGVETKDGRRLHRLQASGATLQPADIGFEGAGAIGLAFFATDDGTPALMELSVDLVQQTAQGATPVKGTMDFAISPDTNPTITAPDPVFATFTSKKGFSFGHPASWDARTADTCEGFDGPSLEWTGACTTAKGSYTVTSRSAAVVAELKTEWKATIVSNVEATVGGEPARVITYTFKGPSGIDVFSMYAIVIHGSTLVEVTWESATGNEQADATMFGYVLASFQFTK